MGLVFVVAFFAAVETAERPLLEVVVVGSPTCGPCRMLKAEWKRAATPKGHGYAWRQWIEKRYRVTFVPYGELPAERAEQIEAIPAVYCRSRDGPAVVLAIPSRRLAVAALGSTLRHRFPPDG